MREGREKGGRGDEGEKIREDEGMKREEKTAKLDDES